MDLVVINRYMNGYMKQIMKKALLSARDAEMEFRDARHFAEWFKEYLSDSFLNDSFCIMCDLPDPVVYGDDTVFEPRKYVTYHAFMHDCAYELLFLLNVLRRTKNSSYDLYDIQGFIYKLFYMVSPYSVRYLTSRHIPVMKITSGAFKMTQDNYQIFYNETDKWDCFPPTDFILECIFMDAP